MARIFTDQACLPSNGAGGGTDWFSDGEGLHSHFFLDAVDGLNNMGAMVNNFGHYAQGINDGIVTRGYTGSAREVFMAQFPVIVPPWAIRMLWTAGVKVDGGDLTAVTSYFSFGKPYTGADADSNAFDPTNINSAAHHSVSMSLSSSGYGLASDASTGIAPLPAFRVGKSLVSLCFVVITITGGTGSTGLDLMDYSCWFSPS